CDQRPVGTEIRGADTGRPLDGPHFLPGPRIVHAQCDWWVTSLDDPATLVKEKICFSPHHGDVSPVGAEYGVDQGSWPFEGQHFLPVPRVIQTHDPTAKNHSNPAAVGAEHDTPDAIEGW